MFAMFRTHWQRIALTLVVYMTACDVPADVTGPRANRSLRPQEQMASSGLTSSVPDFARAVSGLNNENELIVWMKEASDAGLDPAVLRSHAEGRSVVAMPTRGTGSGRQSLPQSHRLSSAAVTRIVEDLDSAGITPYWQGRASPVLAVRIPDSELIGVLSLLLDHPNVDWIEANQRRAIKPDADPLGNNPTDAKHNLHFVQGAWDHTRGSGATVGVLDSGFAGDLPSWTFHPDSNGDSTYGIWKQGFVDDGDTCTSSERAAGQCLPFDDHEHGTFMAGLVGANDNSLSAADWVGIAPFVLTYSMKVSFNADRPSMTCGSWPEGRFCIEGDDLIAALDWASDNEVKVVSMSWSGPLGVSAEAAMGDAYANHDVLLLSSLGNDPGDSEEPQSFSWVMGVGGVASDIQLTHTVNLQYYEIGGYSGGGTTRASCPELDNFCEIGTYTQFSAGSGGTSSATANVAGVAALLRAKYPSLTNVQVRNRIKNTAHGRSYKIADAEWAIENVTPVSVTISGPWLIQSEGQYTWEANPVNGLGAYTYFWEYRLDGGSWQQAGTNKQLTFAVGQGWPDFDLRATVASHGRKAWRTFHVNVDIGDDGDPEEFTSPTSAVGLIPG